MENSIIQQAKKIALNDLRACYDWKGILASRVNFSDYWGRDSFWAIIGIVETSRSGNNGLSEETRTDFDLEQAKKTLELFIRYQRSDGKIPRKICLDYNGLKYLGLRIMRRKPRPIYTSAIRGLYSFDENLLFVIAFCAYVNKTGNSAFAKKHFSHLQGALSFYRAKNLEKDFLLYEIGLGNWMDTIFKKGFVLYTNCLWHKAIKDFEALSERIYPNGRETLNGGSKNLFPASDQVLWQIQSKFWTSTLSRNLKKEFEGDFDAGYFADSVNKQKQPYFDLAGNVLSILFEIADHGQAEKILGLVRKITENSPRINHHEKDFSAEANVDNRISPDEIKLHPLNFPKYPWWKISPIIYLFKIQNYQNGISWSWIEALLIAAKLENGKLKEAQKDLETVSEIIVNNGHIHETYYLDGKPFDHSFWKSAKIFAWGAGLLLFAISKYEKACEDNS